MRILLLLLLLPLCSCASIAELKLRGSDLRYPVSLSASILDASGQRYTPGPSQTVKHFVLEFDHWGWFFGMVSGTEPDLAAMLHEEIEKVEGDGIVNLVIEAGPAAYSWNLPPLNILIPEWMHVRIEGDVFRRLR